MKAVLYNSVDKNNYKVSVLAALILLDSYKEFPELDISKKNFLPISIILTVIVYMLKINFVGYALLIISFIEGIVTKIYELSVSKEFYILSKTFEYNNYNLIYELIQNSFRSFVTLLFFIFNFELKTMVYITLIFMVIGIFFSKWHANEQNDNKN